MVRFRKIWKEFKDSEKLKTNPDGSIKSYYPLDIPQAENINASDVNRFSASDSFTDPKDFGKNYRGAPLYRDFSNARHSGLDVFFKAITISLTPLSLRFNACACPWLP